MPRISTLRCSAAICSPTRSRGIAAAETAVAIAIIINVYRNIGHVQTDDITDLKG